MNHLILVSSFEDRLATWRKGVTGFDSKVFKKDKTMCDRLFLLQNEVEAIKPQAILIDIDFLEIERPGDLSVLHRICTKTKVIVLSGNISEEVEWKLLLAGVKGFCHNDLMAEPLHNVVLAVLRGELWIRRTLINRLVAEIGGTQETAKSCHIPLGVINTLTHREYDVAIRVGNGQNNKQIANECGITERTVKAHLTEIFLKLGVTDRLNLALMLAAESRVDFSAPDHLLSEAVTRSEMPGLSRIRLNA